MKGKKEDKILNQLFRKKLEKAEVDPSGESGKELFHRLGRKEFLRFNPFRFNIWYSGMIAAACAAVVIMYLAGDDRKKPDEFLSPELNDTVFSMTNMPEESNTPEQSLNKVQSPAEKESLNEFNSNSVSEEDSLEITFNRREESPVVALIPEIDCTISGKIVLAEHDPGRKRLRNDTQHDEPIKASAVMGCCPLKVAFEPGAGSFDQCRWSFGDGGVSDEANPEWIFDVEGIYKVTLSTYKSGSIYSVTTCIITVFPKPLARFEIIEENSGFDNTIRLANYSVNAAKSIWEFGDGTTSDLFEPVHTYNEAGDYNIKLIVISEGGCTDTMTLVNPFRDPGYYIEFPNAFLPNLNGPTGGYYSPSSDNNASVFHPVSSGVSEYQLRIFSKTGILIFESNDINIGWDGYYRAQLCRSGVYIWKVRGNYINGEPFTKMGDVTLLKY